MLLYIFRRLRSGYKLYTITKDLRERFKDALII